MGKPAISRGAPRQAVAFGLIVWFVASIDLIRSIRADLLISPEASWAIPRLAVTIVFAFTSVSAGVLAAGLFFLWSRTAASAADTQPLPLGRSTLSLIAWAALAFGILARFAWLDSIPSAVWIDELAPVRPSLALNGSLADLADPIRMLKTDGASYALGSVVQLEAFRFLFQRLGTTLLAIRLPAAVAAAFSLVTTMLLARSLLPRGGSTVAGVILAGLRWQLILGRFAWNVLALTPIIDLATLLLLRARRRSSLAAAAAGGVLAGLGAHVYLGAWIAGAALGVFLLWPQNDGPALRRRMALSFLYGLGFLAAILPIFLLEKGRAHPYFDRASDQSLLRDLRRTKNGMIPLDIVADSFQAPWIVPDPVRRQDLPKSRLGWIIGIPLAAALLRAVRSPRAELSALLFGHAAAAIAASLRWGLPGHPNGYRFLYLTSVTAVAASAGVLWLIQLCAPKARRPATLAAFGLLAAGAFLGAREALLQWGPSREVFDSYWGVSTLVGRASLRWDRYGRVDVDPLLPFSRTVAGQVREFALDPDRKLQEKLAEPASGRCFWITGIAAAPAPTKGERRTEIIRDGWGRDYAVVLARPCR